MGVIVVIGLGELKTWVLEEVGTGNEVGVFDDASDWSMPLVVAPRVQVALIDSPSHEVIVNQRPHPQPLHVQHVI